MALDDNEVNINVTATDRTGNALNSIRTNFRSLGRELSMVGMTMTAMFTVPIVAAFTGLVKMGTDASKQVADARKALDDALASGDKTKIAEATVAWNALTPAVKNAASAYDAITAAIKPAKDESEAIGAELMQALVPVVQQLAPLLVQLADSLEQGVQWFANLPLPMKDVVLGFVALLAAAGPAVVILGKGFEVIGAFAGIAEHLGVVLPALSTGTAEFGASMYAALGPIGALILALTALYAVWQKFGGAAQTTANQAVALGLYGLTGNKNVMIQAATTPEVPVFGKAGGGQFGPGQRLLVGEEGPEVIDTGSTIGYVTPHGGGGSTFQFVYAPQVSMATLDEVERIIAHPVMNIIHKKMGNARG